MLFFRYNPEKASVVTSDVEDKLWKAGVLGDSNPEVLVETVVFLLGIHLALRSSEHRIESGNLQS